MSNDFLDQLAAIEAPQPPPEFDRKLHQRGESRLLVQHLLGLAVGCVPWAAVPLPPRPCWGRWRSASPGRFEPPERAARRK